MRCLRPGLFARSRMLDPLNARGMDTYALLLRDRGDRDSLARLWVDLNSNIGSCPETAMAASTYWECYGDLVKVRPRRLAADCLPCMDHHSGMLEAGLNLHIFRCWTCTWLSLPD